MGRAEQIYTNHYKKMIAKDFKTITLRSLDAKPQLIEAMNEVMQKQGINTGQAVIEFIIADHAKKTKELEKLKQKYDTFYNNHYKVVDKLEEELKSLKSKLQTIKETFQLIIKL